MRKFYVFLLYTLSLSVSAATSLPYLETFDSEGSVKNYTIINADEDKYTWKWLDGRMAAESNPWLAVPEADDWLITPAFDLEAGKTYIFSFDVAMDGYSTERFEVRSGTSPTKAGMTKALAPVREFEEYEENVVLTFVPEVSGTYYFGIRYMSRKNEYFLYVDNVAVSAPLAVNFPASPAGVVATEQGEDVFLSWKAVSLDIKGNELSSADVSYKVLCNDGSEERVLAQDLKDTSYIHRGALDASEQKFYSYTVVAATAAGDGKGSNKGWRPYGTPYTNFADSFAGGVAASEWQSVALEGNAAWSVLPQSSTTRPSADADGGFMNMKGKYADYSAALYSGKVTVPTDGSYRLSFFVYNYPNIVDDENILRLDILDGESEYKVFDERLFRLCSAEGWNKMFVDLSSYAGHTVSFRFTGTVKTNANISLDGFVMAQMPTVDLRAAVLTLPEHVVSGKPFDVVVTVANDGASETSGEVILYINDVEVSRVNTLTIATCQKADVVLTGLISTLNQGEAKIHAAVLATGDEVADNDISMPCQIEPAPSRLPMPGNFKAIVNGGAVELSWTDPVLTEADPARVTVDFEDGTPFAQTYGEWTFIDGDGGQIGGFEGIDFPITEKTRQSFWVHDASYGNGEVFDHEFAAHSGTKYLGGMYNYDGTSNDDWMIAPELHGCPQHITLWAKSYYASKYPEKIQILISDNNTTNRNDFTAVKTVEKVPERWTLYSIDVPEGTKRVALRSMAADGFMLMVDDFSFIPAGEPENLSLSGYEVYRNGQFLAKVKDSAYTDAAPEDLQHEYTVVAVYKNGASQPHPGVVAAGNASSAGVEAVSDYVQAVTGGIVVRGGNVAEVYNMQGMQVCSRVVKGECFISLPSGIYVVTLDGKYIKFAVR